MTDFRDALGRFIRDLEEEADELGNLFGFVSSEAVDNIGYDKDNETLSVTFNSGSVYEYLNVPESKAKYFIDKAVSKGRYLNYRVKGQYTYVRII